jgi:hypothetical protein
MQKKNTPTKGEFENRVEFVRVNGGKISIGAVQISGKEGDHYINLLPSLFISGYGSTPQESQKSLKHNIDLFCEDLLNLSRHEIEKQLLKLGYKKEILKNKNFSKVFIDEKGVLQNFEEGTVNISVMETTSCL